MSLVALVPMKGHSERVPGKNLRPIAGRPLFHWVLDSLIESSLVDEVAVETDSDFIEEAVGVSFPQVMIHRRPPNLIGDRVPMHDIVTNFARAAAHEHVLQTHSTNPLLTSTTIDRAIGVYMVPGTHDSLMSVTLRHSRFFFSDGRPVNHDPFVLVRTQDLEPLLEENSNLYISGRQRIVQTGMRVGTRPLMFPMDPSEALDIDDEHDFRVAEVLLEARHG